MKAIIIAAGHGSRLLPLTLTTPKCLVPVGGRAILDHQLDAIAAAGLAGAVIVGGYRIGQIADHLAARVGGVPAELVFNPFWSAASSIGSVWAAREHLAAPFALMNGDTLFDPALVAGAVAAAPAGVTLVVEPLRTMEADDMLVRVEGGRVRRVAKTLDPAIATHRSLGLVLSRGGRAYADALRAVIGEEGGIHAYHHAVIDRLAGDDAAAAVEVAAGTHWQEIDRPEDIARWGGVS